MQDLLLVIVKGKMRLPVPVWRQTTQWMMGGEVPEFMSPSAHRCLLLGQYSHKWLMQTTQESGGRILWASSLAALCLPRFYWQLWPLRILRGKRLNVCNKQVSNVFTFIVSSCQYIVQQLLPLSSSETTLLCNGSCHCLFISSSRPLSIISFVSPISENYYSAKWTHQLSRVLLIKAAWDREWIVIPPPPPTGWVEALININVTLETPAAHVI